jgi:SpoVK/Ycf46/Vps4 family AAA+-type ATPase
LLSALRTTLVELGASQGISDTLDAVALSQIAKNLVGLSEEEALRVLRQCVLARGRADAGLLDDVAEGKRQALHTEGLLENVKRDASFQDVVGLQRLRDWIAKRKSAWTPEGRQFGLVPPKGILITGVQGCGKSLAARAVAGEWGYDLVRMDAGALYDKFVGESEKHLRKPLELAQKLAPVVLWIDEIEKAFASAGSSSDADAGLSQRLLATLLTWMQDREGRRIPRRHLQQHHRASAGDAAQGPLRRNFLRGLAERPNSRRIIRAASEKAEPGRRRI